MGDLMFERKKNQIKTIASGEVKEYGSIGEAKRESAKLQQSNGGLGMGSLRVVTKWSEKSDD